MRRPPRWYTTYEIANLRRWAALGYSLSAAARKLWRHRGSVAGAAKRYGIKFRGRPGAGRGNRNAVRAEHVSAEHKRNIGRQKAARYRAKLRRLGVRRLSELRDAAD